MNEVPSENGMPGGPEAPVPCRMTLFDPAVTVIGRAAASEGPHAHSRRCRKPETRIKP
jgi:hypothetical protein